VSPNPIDEIERQIDNTRAALDHTIRALRFELSPRHQAEAAWRSAKARTARSLRYSANWAAANPVIVAVGALVLVATSFMMANQRRRH
jgi:hypothetical protein